MDALRTRCRPIGASWRPSAFEAVTATFSRVASATLRLEERCAYFDAEALRQVEQGLARRRHQVDAPEPDQPPGEQRRRAHDFLDNCGEEPPRSELGRIAVGIAGQPRQEGWVEVYVGREASWRRHYGRQGDGAANPWRLAWNSAERSLV